MSMLLGACAASETKSAANGASDATTPASSASSTGDAGSTTSTIFDNPFSDAEIADRLLLDPDEYADGWQLFQFKNVALDRSIAAAVPGCEAHLDTVFESSARPAVTNHRWFHAPPGRAGAMSQYVVVFPTDAAATDMFNAITDPDFHNSCFEPYQQLVMPDGTYCCDPSDVFPAPLWDGSPVTTPTTLGADDISIRSDDAQTWTDAAGTLHGPETVQSATIRVGRTITVLEAIMVDEFGQSFVTDEQFQHAIATASERAVHAIGGVNH